MHALLEKLRAPTLSEFLEALEQIAATLEAGEALELDLESVDLICQVFAPEQLDYPDLRILQTRVVDVLFMYREKLGHRLMVGLTTYTLGLLEGVYDGGGFDTVGGALERIAARDALLIVHQLGEANPDSAELFGQYAALLEQISAASSVCQTILSHIGNRCLAPLSKLVHAVEDTFRGQILTALSAFEGDLDVLLFFDDYIAFYQRIQTAEGDDLDVRTICELKIAQARQSYPRGNDAACPD